MVDGHFQITSDIKKALKQTVLLDSGEYGFVFSELKSDGIEQRWKCHICSRVIVSERAMSMHLNHPVHNSKLLIPKHPKCLFDTYTGSKGERTTASQSSDFFEERPTNVTKVLPGEPAPPGLEDELEGECQIQATFDAYKSGPLIGLEYIVELVSSEEVAEPRYICLLCEKRGDPRSVLVHVTSQNHYLKYISCFFRTAGNALNMIPRTNDIRRGINIAILKVAAEIEKHYGRLKPTSAEAETFSSKKYEILSHIDEKQHFRETPSTTFADLVTIEKIREYSSISDTKSNMFNDHPSTTRKDERVKPPKRSLEEQNARKSVDSDVIVIQDDKKSVDIETKSLSSISTLSSTSRSRSRERSPRRSRSRSISPRSRYKRGSFSRGRSRSRSRSYSPHRKYNYRRQRYERSRYERSHSRSRYRGSTERYWRSPPRYSPYASSAYKEKRPCRSRSRSYERQRENRDYKYSRGRDSSSETREKASDEVKASSKIKWATFREKLITIEVEMAERLTFYTSRPEQHPKYSQEWKEFWNRRYKEVQISGQDPNSYDYKPEWVLHWNKRMKELHDLELAERKEELRQRLDLDECRKMSSDLQDISPPTPEGTRDVTVSDVKNTWKALTGTEIISPNRSPSPWEDTKTPPPPPAIKKDSPPPVQTRQKESSGFYEIVPPIVHCLRMLLVLENQLGSLAPKVLDVFERALALEKTKQSASMTLLQNKDIYFLLETVKEKFRGQVLAGVVPRNLVGTTKSVIKSIDSMLKTNPLNLEVLEPITMGSQVVDKVAVAQKIAAALVSQGRTDVSQIELEELINAVVGIAEKSNAIPTQNMSSADFFSRLNIQNSTGSSHINEIISKMISQAQCSMSASTSVAPSPPVSAPIEQKLEVECTKSVESVGSCPSTVTDTSLKTQLVNFKDLMREEQHKLIQVLQDMESSDPLRVEKLREVVATSLAQDTKADKKEARLSPFSLRSGGANPSPESKDLHHLTDEDDDDDDDYSFEDVYRAASEELKLQQQKAETRDNLPPIPPSIGDNFDKIKNILSQLQSSQPSSSTFGVQDGYTTSTAQNPGLQYGNLPSNQDLNAFSDILKPSYSSFSTPLDPNNQQLQFGILPDSSHPEQQTPLNHYRTGPPFRQYNEYTSNYKY